MPWEIKIALLSVVRASLARTNGTAPQDLQPDHRHGGGEIRTILLMASTVLVMLVLMCGGGRLLMRAVRIFLPGALILALLVQGFHVALRTLA
jgi:hypothetical protein